MSLALLVPAALAALAALLLPLVLHLQRRRQQPRTVMFAALRWLGESARPQRRVRLVDPWLLLVRCLLLASVVLLLAQPVLYGMNDGRAWHVLVPGIDPDSIDWPAGTDAIERRWLVDGFPALQDAAPAPTAPVATGSLLRELDARLPAESALTVYLPAEIDGLDGARLALSRAVDWRVVPSATASVTAPETAASMLRIAIGGADVDDARWRYLQAAQAAWAADTGAEPVAPVEFDPTRPPPAGLDAVIWLSQEPVPAPLASWLADGGRLLVFVDADAEPDDAVDLWHGQAGAVLRGARSGRGERRTLDCPLAPRCLPELLDGGFPALLKDWLLPVPTAPTRARADHVAPSIIAQRLQPQPRPLADWFALLAALLFLSERWLANGRRAA
jgi:hypothetical protein